MVREGDFRASGSGNMKFEKREFDERCIKIAFETNKKLKSQCLLMILFLMRIMIH